MRRILSRRALSRAIATVAIEPIEQRLLMSTYTVNTTSDAPNPGSGLLTLRQAVADADAHAGADTIAFSSKVFAPGSLHTITLTRGQITFSDKTGATAVNGPGSAVVAVDGDKSGRIFDISSGVTVSVTGMTLTDGAVTTAPGVLATGGAVLNAGSLTLNGVTLSGNSAAGGDDTSAGGGNGGAADGGAIYTTGKLSLVNSIVSGNTAQGGTAYAFGKDGGAAAGGGIYATASVTITGGSISGNTAAGGVDTNTSFSSAGGQAQGGGIWVSGSLSVNSTALSDDQAIGGSGFSNLAASSSGAPASGGAVFASGTVTVAASSFSGDQALGGSASPDSGGAGAASGGAISDGAVANGKPVSITSSSFTNNSAAGGAGPWDDNGPGADANGGAIAAGSTTLTSSIVSNNSAIAGAGAPIGANGGVNASASGGGISAGTLEMQNSTVSGNTAKGAGGDQSGYAGSGGTGTGGGVATGGGSILDSTISGNSAIGGAGDSHRYFGKGGSGAEGQGGGVSSDGTLTVTNSTVTGNKAVGGAGTYEGSAANASGGGIDSSGTLTLNDTTISGNTATGGPGGPAPGIYPNGPDGVGQGAGVAIVSGTALLNNTVVSGDQADGSFNDILGTAKSTSSHNLIGVGGGLTNGVNGNKVGVNNPQLQPLGWYGGPTQTMLPMPTSPVIDAGNISLIPSGVKTDQRGFPRTRGNTVDIGSVEFGGVVITGTVFNDEYATGKRQAGDPGLAGFTVYLDLNHDGNLDAGDYSVLTNSSGQYTFDGLFAGGYSVNVEYQKNYRLTTPVPQKVTAQDGQTVTVAAIGETQDALISGTVTNSTTHSPLSGWRVYIDLNDDGKWESSEPGVVTTANGDWSFNIPSPGTYYVRIVPMAHYETTSPSGGVFSFVVGKASARIGNVFAEKLLNV